MADFFSNWEYRQSQSHISAILKYIMCNLLYRKMSLTLAQCLTLAQIRLPVFYLLPTWSTIHQTNKVIQECRESELVSQWEVQMWNTHCVFIAVQLCVYYLYDLSLSMQFQFQFSGGWGGESHIWALLLIERSTGPQGLPRWRFLNPWLFNAGCAWVIKQIISN